MSWLSWLSVVVVVVVLSCPSVLIVLVAVAVVLVVVAQGMVIDGPHKHGMSLRTFEWAEVQGLLLNKSASK